MRGWTRKRATVTDFAAIPGGGVRATVDGAAVLVGSARFLAGEGVALDASEAVAAGVAAAEGRGETVVWVAVEWPSAWGPGPVRRAAPGSRRRGGRAPHDWASSHT